VFRVDGAPLPFRSASSFMQVRAVDRVRCDLLRSTQKAGLFAAASTPLTRRFALQIAAGSQGGSQAGCSSPQRTKPHAPGARSTRPAARLNSTERGAPLERMAAVREMVACDGGAPQACPRVNRAGQASPRRPRSQPRVKRQVRRVLRNWACRAAVSHVVGTRWRGWGGSGGSCTGACGPPPRRRQLATAQIPYGFTISPAMVSTASTMTSVSPTTTATLIGTARVPGMWFTPALPAPVW
jgi:hypothetical protein